MSLLELIIGMTSFIYSVSQACPVVRLTNLGRVHELLEDETGRRAQLLARTAMPDRAALISSMPMDRGARQELAAAVSSMSTDYRTDNVQRLIQRLHEAGISDACENSGDLHGIESVGGIGVRFFLQDGRYVADGGNYQRMARRFSVSLRNVVSVATGLEWLTSLAPAEGVQHRAVVHVLKLDADDGFVLAAAIKLRAIGYSVRIECVEGPLSRALRLINSDGLRVVIGRSEQESRTIRICSRADPLGLAVMINEGANPRARETAARRSDP